MPLARAGAGDRSGKRGKCPEPGGLTRERDEVGRTVRSDCALQHGADHHKPAPILQVTLLCLKQRIDELRWIEWRQIADTLACPNEFDRQTQLRGNRKDNPATGRTIQLRQNNATDPSILYKLLRLSKPILPGRRVERQQHLMRSLRIILL